MRILTVCEGGNIRSGTLATILKEYMGYKDTLAVGVLRAEKDTLDMLCEWADKIFVVGQMTVVWHLCKRFRDKVVHFNIGNDVWGVHVHPELVDILVNKIKEFSPEKLGVSQDKIDRVTEWRARHHEFKVKVENRASSSNGSG